MLVVDRMSYHEVSGRKHIGYVQCNAISTEFLILIFQNQANKFEIFCTSSRRRIVHFYSATQRALKESNEGVEDARLNLQNGIDGYLGTTSCDTVIPTVMSGGFHIISRFTPP